MEVCGTEALDGKLQRIVTEFAARVKGLAAGIAQVREVSAVERLEREVRQEGQRMLGRLLGELLQRAINAGQEALRICPHCSQRRHHQGVRPRRVICCFGELHLAGIYWRCEGCGRCDHSAEQLLPEHLTGLMEQLTCLVGASLASFAKAELVAQRIMQVDLDDGVIRRTCLKKGDELLREQAPVTEVTAGDLLVGSCDGTMVNTREDHWREVKAFRFEHAGGIHGGAFLENAQTFTPRLKTAAAAFKAERAGKRLFLSDAAEWIGEVVDEKLPSVEYVIDFYHAGRHLVPAAEELYGHGSKDATRWSHYWHHRLKQFGGGYVQNHLYDLASHYPCQPGKQAEILKAARFFWKHQKKMDYPRYLAEEWPIGSGPMESFCKQLGHRLKGAEMRWNLAPVTPMAMLVSNWCILAETSPVFGARAA